MNELLVKPEIADIKRPESEGFKDIKPEGGMVVQDARAFVDGVFAEAGEDRRPLNEDTRAKLDEGGMSKVNIDKCTGDDAGKVYLKTINEDKVGQTGENGVPYERKTIDVNGADIVGVFPQFDSKCDVQLPDDLYKASDAKQADACNQKLQEDVDNDPELAKQFTNEQREQIRNGETPDGYTWHHNEEPGKMQLVKTEDHQKNSHTGGKSIWGGGKENR